MNSGQYNYHIKIEENHDISAKNYTSINYCFVLYNSLNRIGITIVQSVQIQHN